MNFQHNIPSISIDNFTDHYVYLFDLTSMREATEKCHYLELVGEPPKLELNFTILLEYTTNFNLLRELMFSDAVDKFTAVEKKMKMD